MSRSPLISACATSKLCCTLPSRPAPPRPAPQTVLGVLLGGDVRSSLGRVGAVAGVVVLRTLLQVRPGRALWGCAGLPWASPGWAVLACAPCLRPLIAPCPCALGAPCPGVLVLVLFSLLAPSRLLAPTAATAQEGSAGTLAPVPNSLNFFSPICRLRFPPPCHPPAPRTASPRSTAAPWTWCCASSWGPLSGEP